MTTEKRLGRVRVSYEVLLAVLSFPPSTKLHHITVSGWRPDYADLLLSDPSFREVDDAEEVPEYRYVAYEVQGHFESDQT